MLFIASPALNFSIVARRMHASGSSLQHDLSRRIVRFFFLNEVKGRRSMLKKFKDLTEKEILAIAIGAEEEDGRIYGEFADALRDDYPSTAQMFEDMRAEEIVHRDRLFEMFRHRFGDYIPLIRRENVKGFLQRRPVWLVRPLGVKVARKQAELMELEAQRFYHKAASRTADASTRELLNQLADEERKHTQTAGELEEKHLTASAKEAEEASHKKLFLLQVVQPGLAGLMDWAVSTLAPLFAAAFASQKSSEAFLVGLAASIGAGISMAFSEGLSDDGSLTGRGSPWLRGGVTGLMTTAGGIGDTEALLIRNFYAAKLVAVLEAAVEPGLLHFVGVRYMDKPLLVDVGSVYLW